MAPALKWDDYRPEDYTVARLTVHRARVLAAKRVIKEWLLCSAKPYISCSGGKDSVAMLHLIQDVATGAGLDLLPVLWHDSGVEFPKTAEVFERLRAMGLIAEMVVVRPDEDVLALKRQQEDGKISAATKDNRALFKPIAKAVKRHGFDGVALGLRKGESNARLMSRVSNGLLYRRKRDDAWVCQPLGDWDWTDVFAYTATHKLPLHPIYSAPLLGLEHRGRIRLSWWASTDYKHHGELAWLKAVYPILFNRLAALIPEVRGYV